MCASSLKYSTKDSSVTAIYKNIYQNSHMFCSSVCVTGCPLVMLLKWNGVKTTMMSTLT